MQSSLLLHFPLVLYHNTKPLDSEFMSSTTFLGLYLYLQTFPISFLSSTYPVFMFLVEYSLLVKSCIISSNFHSLHLFIYQMHIESRGAIKIILIQMLQGYKSASLTSCYLHFKSDTVTSLFWLLSLSLS